MKGELDGKWQRKKDQQISFSKGRGKPYKTFNTHLVSISFTHYKSNVIFCVFHTVSFIRNPFVLISYFVIQTITFLIFFFFLATLASLVTHVVKNLLAMQETWVCFQVGKIPWRRKWLPTPVFLPRVSHGQRSLAGYSP